MDLGFKDSRSDCFFFQNCMSLYREYHLVMQRYEISLQVKYFFTLRREILYLQAAMQHSMIIWTPVKCQIIFIIFAAKGLIYYITIATVISSHVKITCYVIFTWEDMFSSESSAGISLVFIYNKKTFTSNKVCILMKSNTLKKLSCFIVNLHALCESVWPLSGSLHISSTYDFSHTLVYCLASASILHDSSALSIA